MTKVNCNEIIEEVRADLNLSIKECNAKIAIHELPSVMGYNLELRVLFQNLLSNALKFRSADLPEITISCSNNGESWLFSVSDNGIGIDPVFSEKIFKLYQRLHPRGEYQGYGLGLAQCHKIVTELHNGRIWVERNNPKGSRFYFTIPFGI